MSYYPLLNAPNCKGWVGLSNFSPNNWEAQGSQSRFINVTWLSGGEWKTECIGVIAPGACKTVTASDVAHIVPNGTLPLISLTCTLPAESDVVLPQVESKLTSVPSWRATLGLSSSETKTSYQGELDAFPPRASLLTFGPFMQFGAAVENYLILLNIETAPVRRSADLEVYDSLALKLRKKFIIKSNSCNVIPLDDLGFSIEDLPVFICRTMAAIPLYFSTAENGRYLSLEHTHPPASMVIHGQRWEAQKLLKLRWFAKA
jgi:hypothetical protein